MKNYKYNFLGDIIIAILCFITSVWMLYLGIAESALELLFLSLIMCGVCVFILIKGLKEYKTDKYLDENIERVDKG